MYLHIGQNMVVPMGIIIGIFDLDNSSVSAMTRSFLKQATERKQVINVSDELPKSFILCEDNGKTRVYISQLAASTLLKRVENNTFV